jgi:Undecaprenyl-phosphate glucose phosphotransferase
MKHRGLIFLLRVAADFLLINISFLLAAFAAQPAELLFENSLMFVLMAMLNFSWFISGNFFKLYDEPHPKYFIFDIIKTFKTCLAQIAVAILFLFITREDLFTRYFILFYFTFTLVLITVKKIVFKIIIEQLSERGISVKNLIIIGAGETGQNFHNSVKQAFGKRYNFLGFLDDAPPSAGLKVLGTLPQLDEILTKNEADEVVIALSGNEFAKLDDLIKTCNKHAVRSFIIPDYFKFLSNTFNVSMFDNIPIIAVRSEPLSEFPSRAYKRLLDIASALFVIIFIFSWLFPIVIILQKIFSPGPVFFIQERVGYKNKTFRCYKFRSMSIEASSKKNEFQAHGKTDPRITKFGSFLRKTNIDELPQFINVLLGDMSLVGPRPQAVAFFEVYKQYVDELKLRHIVKPGITGWAQIHGLRGDSPNEEENKANIRKRFEYDLWYIDNWSFKLDMQIIFITVWRIFSGEAKGI